VISPHAAPAATCLRLAAALGLAAAAACDAPRAPTCEGEPVGTLQFHGDLVPGDAGCPFAPDAGISFTATIAFGSGASALLCVDKADAQPLRGTRDGDHILLSSDAGAANVPSCACDVLVVESVEGDLVRGDAGSATGFTGELRDALSPADADAGASCERNAGTPDEPRCGVPCSLRWTLTGS
jgi:hypothetical protein